MIAPTVRAFPSDDEAFQAHIADVINLVQSESSRDAADFVERIQETVKLAYPNARIAPMHVLAQAGHPGPVWYAYREGALRPTTRSNEVESTTARAGG